MNILVSQVSYFASVGIIKLLKKLKRADLHIYGTSYMQTGMTSGSLLVEQCFLSPHIGDSGRYLDFMCTICKTKRIDLLFVSDDDELILLKEKADLLNCKLICADKDLLHLVTDKEKASLAMHTIGIPTPTIIHDLCSGLPISKKIIFRNKRGVGSKGIYKVDLSTAQYIENHFAPNIFIQECVVGQEYTVDIFCDRDGQLKLAIPRKRIDIRNGVSYKCIIEYVPQIIDYCKVIYENYKIPGLSNVQFILQNEKALFIELNPRFAGTGIASSMASFNVLSPYIDHFCNGNTLESFQKYMGYVAWNSIITRYYEETLLTDS